MTPDYQRAATLAIDTLIRFNVGTAPIDPLPFLKKTPGVLVMSFDDMSKKAQLDRKEVLNLFGCDNHDAVTTAYVDTSSIRYVVTYNKILSSMIIDRALARELGHIVLGHDGSRPESVRDEEAKCFAQHLLVPRPLIHAIQATGIRLTTELLNNLTGCNDTCLSCMRRYPSVHVPPEMNRAVRDNFMPYILNFIEYHRYATNRDVSALADFGSYMEGYEE